MQIEGSEEIGWRVFHYKDGRNERWFCVGTEHRFQLSSVLLGWRHR